MSEKLSVNFSLCLVTDEASCKGRKLEYIVEEAVKGGVSWVQLREKHLDTKAFVERAFLLKKILSPLGIPLIINDRIDVALAVDADGVHLGQSDMPVVLARKILPGGKLIGLSIEHPHQLLAAAEAPVDYLGVGPIFPTLTKNDAAPAWGIEELKAFCTLTRHKIVAIGGIQLHNAELLQGTGISGIAVVSAICSAKDPRKAAEALLRLV